MKWKEIVEEYLSFSRKDRIALLILALLILGVAIVPALVSSTPKTRPLTAADSAWLSAGSKLDSQEMHSGKYYKSAEGENRFNNLSERETIYHDRKPAGELFIFDPNTISPAGWKRLGLRDKTITTIQNFISKGGRFYQPEDLSTIYGLFDDEYERLEPYIRIEKTTPVSTDSKKEFISNRSPIAVEINSADTSAFIRLPGIGSKLAYRIITFREKLGGFHSIEQVGETFGLKDSVFNVIKPYLQLNATTVKTININTVTKEVLIAHPYFRNIASAIIAYREEHGLFSEAEELKKIIAITDEVFKKILPYITIEKQ